MHIISVYRIYIGYIYIGYISGIYRIYIEYISIVKVVMLGVGASGESVPETNILGEEVF